MLTRTNITRVIGCALLVLALVSLSGCGREENRTEGREGIDIHVDGLIYQVQMTRPLNPRDTEDAGYLGDLPEPPTGSQYLGVFLRVENKERGVRQPLPSERLRVVDTSGNSYSPTEGGAENFAYLPTPLDEDEMIPIPDSPAYNAPIVGSLVLYTVKTSSLQNLPLKLMIEGENAEGEVELDI